MEEDNLGMSQQQISLADIINSFTNENGETLISPTERNEILLDWNEQFPTNYCEPIIKEVEVIKKVKSVEYLVGGLIIGYVLSKFVKTKK